MSTLRSLITCFLAIETFLAGPEGLLQHSCVEESIYRKKKTSAPVHKEGGECEVK